MSEKHTQWAKSLAADCGVQTSPPLPLEIALAQPRTRRGPMTIPLEEKGVIAGEYAAGLKLKEIQRRHGTSAGSILEIVDEKGVPRRFPEMGAAQSRAKLAMFRRRKKNERARERRAAAKERAVSVRMVADTTPLPQPSPMSLAGTYTSIEVETPRKVGFWRSLGMMLGFR